MNKQVAHFEASRKAEVKMPKTETGLLRHMVVQCTLSVKKIKIIKNLCRNHSKHFNALFGKSENKNKKTWSALIHHNPKHFYMY